MNADTSMEQIIDVVSSVIQRFSSPHSLDNAQTENLCARIALFSYGAF